MQLDIFLNRNRKLVLIEFHKCFGKNIYIISIVYFLFLVFYTHFNLTLQRVISKVGIGAQTGALGSVEESLFQSILTQGCIIFGILVIVVFGKEISNGTYKKMLVSGYNRFELYFGSLIRIGIFIIYFVALSGIILLVFYLPIIDLSYDNIFAFRIIAICLGFLYVGMISFSIILLTKRIFLSILIVAIFIYSIPAVFLLNQLTIDSSLVVFFPFAVLKYLKEPSRIILDNNFYGSYFIYYIFFSWVSFRTIETKKFV